MSDENITSDDGGKAGGEGADAVDAVANPIAAEPEKLILRRSEMAILRRMADRFPSTDKQRQTVVDQVMDTLVTTKSKKTKLAAARTFAALESVNLKELGNYIAAKRTIRDELEPAAPQPVIVQVNQETTVVQQVAVSGTEKLLDEYADIIDEEAGVPAEPAPDDGTGEQVHPPEANAKAGPLSH